LAPLIKFPPPLLQVAPQLKKKGLSRTSQGQKLWNFRPPEIPASGAEFLAQEKTSIRKRL
jgi:hypothetical protein